MYGESATDGQRRRSADKKRKKDEFSALAGAEATAAAAAMPASVCRLVKVVDCRILPPIALATSLARQHALP